MIKHNYNILACETSCDETAFAVYNNKKGIISSIVKTQIELHKVFNGVVPEITSKEHLKFIDIVCKEALEKANLRLKEIDFFASTNNPGLPGALLIGSQYTKALAWVNKKLFIPINHLSGHIYSASIENDIIYPAICISASGGHTSIYLVKNELEYEELGTTRDDAAGECFDKVGRSLGLEYPAGAEIESLAKEVNFIDKRKYPRSKIKDYSFSFSGLKTAVLYDLINNNYYDKENKKILESVSKDIIKEISSSLLNAIADIFLDKIKKGISEYKNVKSIIFVGGVACNKFIRSKIDEYAKKRNLLFFYPSNKYCTDNAAMISKVAYFKIKKAIEDKDLNFFNLNEGYKSGVLN